MAIISQDVFFKTNLKIRALKNHNSSFLSKRALALEPSLTLEITAMAKALKAQGKDICSLSAGEPDFDTPQFIVEAARKALADGLTRYGPAAGDPELRNAIARKLSEINKIPTNQENVLITNGGKQAIYNLFQIILDPGDEVLIPSPYWLSYPQIASLAGAVPKIIESEFSQRFKIDIDKLEKSITERTKLLILNTPNNPSGLVLEREELESIAEILRKHPKIFVLCDEIYEYLLAEGKNHFSFASIALDMKERIFTVNGFAKGWAMTGWRVGYLAGDESIIEKATALQSQSTSNVCSFAQRGALAAVNGSHDCVKDMVLKYNQRRSLLSEGLNKISGVDLVNPQGAFYAFPKIEKDTLTSVEFCKRSLEEVGLSMVPGIAFGNDNCIRISCAVSSKTIQDGLDRLNQMMSTF